MSVRTLWMSFWRFKRSQISVDKNDPTTTTMMTWARGEHSYSLSLIACPAVVLSDTLMIQHTGVRVAHCSHSSNYPSQ